VEERGKRSVFFAKDIHQVNLILGKFLQKSGAATVLLVDSAGHLVARQGERSPASEDTITALVAGTYSASCAMAEILGTEEFSSFIPRGNGGNLMLLRAGASALLAVAFGDDSAVSLVRTYALEMVRRLDPFLRRAGPPADGDDSIEKERFDQEIDGALNDVFG
jgi:predicted regulator of Ras-like GTPase activity (Roadblock/LC7/MglB family)